MRSEGRAHRIAVKTATIILSALLLAGCAAPAEPPLVGKALEAELARISENRAAAIDTLRFSKDHELRALFVDLYNLALWQGHEIDRLRADLAKSDALLTAANEPRAEKLKD